MRPSLWRCETGENGPFSTDAVHYGRGRFGRGVGEGELGFHAAVSFEHLVAAWAAGQYAAQRVGQFVGIAVVHKQFGHNLVGIPLAVKSVGDEVGEGDMGAFQHMAHDIVKQLGAGRTVAHHLRCAEQGAFEGGGAGGDKRGCG